MAALKPNGKQLLIVEDDDHARVAMASLLRGVDYEVTLAANGQEALDLLHKDPTPDLILLDMLMPVLDGWHFHRQLKALPFLAAVPIVVVTGTILTREWAQSHGCAGLLHKPVDPEALLQEIRRCLP